MPLIQTQDWTLWQGAGLFCLCALAIAIAGTRITRVVDQLADRTGIGEAAAGAVLLGISTSLGGCVLSVTASWNGHAELAVSNALGGIAVQTFFLALADMSYRKANLEHAAASVPNMMQNALLISLLSLVLLATYLPSLTFFGIHPVSPLLFVLYGYGISLVRKAQDSPMWRPSITRETREDVPDDVGKMPPLSRLWREFLLLMLILGVAGWGLEPAANVIAEKAGVSYTVIGVMLTAISTSIPELVTSVAAVRRGALTLAVGGIIGGNAFDVLFISASDIAYRAGSIYHAVPQEASFWLALNLFMSGILIMGLIRREKHGIAGIGWESAAIMVLYLLGVFLLLNTPD
ncbi:sodium:calcium antiporter [Bowmanella dokdonensis]|uniref:sodium:calcium antiporter n=1 Tax=Bowmanella dokdonensis TaxID=751969 RepID=UPI001F499851|nr:sodium:calcium antiporter [Bowmanella dokdonensis]